MTQGVTPDLIPGLPAFCIDRNGGSRLKAGMTSYSPNTRAKMSSTRLR